jgi:hypothetical protein
MQVQYEPITSVAPSASRVGGAKVRKTWAHPAPEPAQTRAKTDGWRTIVRFTFGVHGRLTPATRRATEGVGPGMLPSLARRVRVMAVGAERGAALALTARAGGSLGGADDRGKELPFQPEKTFGRSMQVQDKLITSVAAMGSRVRGAKMRTTVAHTDQPAAPMGPKAALAVTGRANGSEEEGGPADGDWRRARALGPGGEGRVRADVPYNSSGRSASVGLFAGLPGGSGVLYRGVIRRSLARVRGRAPFLSGLARTE